ncbi:unnamed protein product [Symbiodinium sp. CCMP2592]|nr:unnamed protein product [Symbiodinium sp. CCMP2592]
MENLFKSLARFGWHPRLREGIVHNLNHAEQSAKASTRYDFEGFLQSFALSLEIYTNWVTQLIAASPWLFHEMEMPKCILEVHSIMSFTALIHALSGLLVQQSFSAYEGFTYREFTQCRFRMRILAATLQFIIAHVSAKKLVKTELAVQWWSEKDNFLDYATVVLGASLGRHVEQETVNGHIAAGLEEFNLTRDLTKFKWMNAQSTFFPARRQYNSMFQDAFDACWKRNYFPRWSKPDLTEFIHDQWKQHLDQLNEEERFNFKSVQKLKQFFNDNFVIHNEDHCSGHVMLFCPNLCYSTQWTTWTDETVFTRLPYAPREYQQAFAQQIPQDLRKRYSWGFKSDPRCPRGYIFMKRKKQWTTARTIVSYWNSLAAPLLTATSMALSSIISSTWPEQLGTGTTPQLWSDIHRFLRAQSVVNAVQRLLDEYRATHNDTCIMVNPHSHFKRYAAHAGSSLASCKANYKTVYLEDVERIVLLSFQLGVFEAMGVAWKQTRGTAIGNQISPILSTICVAAMEIHWKRTFPNTLAVAGSQVLIQRYVDNRLILATDFAVQLPGIQVLLHQFFYKRPVELEHVLNHEYLGMLVNVSSRTVTFKPLTHGWQIRSPKSAGTWNSRLSGLKSRLSIILKYAYPKTISEQQADDLCEFFTRMGFPPDRVWKRR